MAFLATLKTTMDTAVSAEVTPYLEFMDQLKADAGEIADILASVYNTYNPAVIFSYAASVDMVTLHFCRDLFHDREEELDAMTQAELDETDVTEEYYWTIAINREETAFVLSYNTASPDPNDHFPDKGEENIAFKDFPLTEYGYQYAIAAMVTELSRFLPDEVKLAYYHENNRRRGQQAIDFMLK